jgi:hypothetical protein
MGENQPMVEKKIMWSVLRAFSESRKQTSEQTKSFQKKS